MLHLGICEDDRGDQKKIYDLVSRTLFKYEDSEYRYFSDGREVVEAIRKEDFDLDLLFLDIHMPECDGLETARYIRENEIDVDIIFVTVSAEHVFDGYRFRAFSYLLKPVEEGRISDEIDRYIAERGSLSRCLHVNINGRREQILLDRVLYFMGEGRKVGICQKNQRESVSFYAKLCDVEAMLENQDFVRCHQSYLVNRRYIKSFSRTEINVGGERVPISRKYADSAWKALTENT